MPRWPPASAPYHRPFGIGSGAEMRALVGLAIMLAAFAGLLLARPRGGTPRSFVNTRMEVPVALSILGTMAVALVLIISGLFTSGR
jgi:hypothetical protein